MDGLGGAASVIAVIQIAQSVGSALKDYYKVIRDAREDIRKLYDSVRGLEDILTSLQDVLNRKRDRPSSNARLFTNPSGPLRQAEVELQGLRLLLIPSMNTTSSGMNVPTLKWPLKKEDVEKAVLAIERHKSSLNLDFGVRHFDIAEDIRLEIRAAREDASRLCIKAWLSRDVPDPSKQHKFARQKHEKTTGDWLIQGYKFKTWLGTKNSLLWLAGGAGAGKSILCSTAIDHAQQLCTKEPNSVAVYWYFTFTDVETFKVPNLLSSLIADICSNRRDTPKVLQEGYNQANYGQQKPTTTSLLRMLKEVATGFDHIYLFMDALDECSKIDGERSRLLDVIKEIHNWKLDCLHMLLTSRNEPDIEESFDRIIFESGSFQRITAHGIEVDEDIRKYLRQRLQDQMFSKWNTALKSDVEKHLASQAKGMFRLVALQLDSLSKLRAESSIRYAMEELPRTLDDFYERILLEIEDNGDRDMAYVALQALAFAAYPMSLEELAEAVIVRPEKKPYFNETDRFLEPLTLLDVLPAGLVSTSVSTLGTKKEIELFGSVEEEDASQEDLKSSLIRSKNDGLLFDEQAGEVNVQFAHFSVKEYLISQRAASGPASKYYFTEFSAHNLLAQTCFAYLISVGDLKPRITTGIHRRFPLLHYAARCWPVHTQAHGNVLRGRLEELFFDFLLNDSAAWNIWKTVACDPSDLIFDKFQSLNSTYASYTRQLISINPSTVHPLYFLAVIGASALLKNLLENNINLEEIPQTGSMGSPLYAAAFRGHALSLDVLLRAGFNVESEGGFFGRPLQAASVGGHNECVKLLLNNGADVNAQSGHYGNALQAASSSTKDLTDTVKLLLDNGVNLHATGGEFYNALCAAAFKGNAGVVQLLVDAGADVNGQVVALADTVGGMYPNAPDDDPLSIPQNVLIVASRRGHFKVVHLLLQNGADINWRLGEAQMNWSALSSAAVNGHTEVVQLLLEAGADTRVNGEWEQMCQKVTEKTKSGDTEHSGQHYRDLLALLEDWLAKLEAHERATSTATVKDVDEVDIGTPSAAEHSH